MKHLKMANITDKFIIVIPVTQEINDTEVDNLEIEQPEQGNNQQADIETEKLHDGVVIVNDDEVTTIQHWSKAGRDEDCENPEDIEDKIETLVIDKEKESMKQNEDQMSSKENIDKCAENDTRGVADAQDCNEETNKNLFAWWHSIETSDINVKGDKEQFRWTSDLQQLKDFTTLILNVCGTWKKAGIKHTFREAQGKLTIIMVVNKQNLARLKTL